MIELSQSTKELIGALFEGDERDIMVQRLLTECSENIPFHEDSSPKEMERIRFAVMKLCHESMNNWDDWFNLAQVDWRDLFMSAGFGYDIMEHENWKKKMLTK